MWGQIVSVLITQGLPGVVIVALAWAYYKKDQKLQELQASRVQDAQDVTETLLTLADKNRIAMAAMTDAIEKQLPALARIESTVSKRK